MKRCLITARRMGFDQEAEDLAQDAMVSFVEQGKCGQTVEQCVIDCVRRAYGHSHYKTHRKAPRWHISLDELRQTPDCPSERLFEWVNLKTQLTPKERELLLLRGAYGLSFREIGEFLGMSESGAHLILAPILAKAANTQARVLPYRAFEPVTRRKLTRTVRVTESRCPQVLPWVKPEARASQKPRKEKKQKHQPKPKVSYCLWCTGAIPHKQKYCSEVCRKNWLGDEA